MPKLLCVKNSYSKVIKSIITKNNSISCDVIFRDIEYDFTDEPDLYIVTSEYSPNIIGLVSAIREFNFQNKILYILNKSNGEIENILKQYNVECITEEDLFKDGGLKFREKIKMLTNTKSLIKKPQQEQTNMPIKNEEPIDKSKVAERPKTITIEQNIDNDLEVLKAVNPKPQKPKPKPQQININKDNSQKENKKKEKENVMKPEEFKEEEMDFIYYPPQTSVQEYELVYKDLYEKYKKNTGKYPNPNDYNLTKEEFLSALVQAVLMRSKIKDKVESKYTQSDINEKRREITQEELSKIEDILPIKEDIPKKVETPSEPIEEFNEEKPSIIETTPEPEPETTSSDNLFNLLEEDEKETYTEDDLNEALVLDFDEDNENDEDKLFTEEAVTNISAPAMDEDKAIEDNISDVIKEEMLEEEEEVIEDFFSQTDINTKEMQDNIRKLSEQSKYSMRPNVPEVNMNNEISSIPQAITPEPTQPENPFAKFKKQTEDNSMQQEESIMNTPVSIPQEIPQEPQIVPQMTNTASEVLNNEIEKDKEELKEAMDTLSKNRFEFNFNATREPEEVIENHPEVEEPQKNEANFQFSLTGESQGELQEESQPKRRIFSKRLK